VNAPARRAIFLVGALGAFVFVAWGLAGLPDFGHYAGAYGGEVVARTEPVRHAQNAVTTVVMDIRGVDTAGEELILLAAVVGVLMALRDADDEHTVGARLALPPRAPAKSRAVSVVTIGLVAPAAVVGMYIVSHGQLTPGGGFQGGVMLAVPSVLVLLGARHRTFEHFHPGVVWEIVQAIAVTAFLAVGYAGLIAHRGFLANVLGYGVLGTVFSAGTIALLNVISAPAVATAIVLVVLQLYHQVVEVRRD
jgi:multicomponent Na+:H+ antiporter subunit B